MPPKSDPELELESAIRAFCRDYFDDEEVAEREADTKGDELAEQLHDKLWLDKEKVGKKTADDESEEKKKKHEETADDGSPKEWAPAASA